MLGLLVPSLGSEGRCPSGVADERPRTSGASNTGSAMLARNPTETSRVPYSRNGCGG